MMKYECPCGRTVAYPTRVCVCPAMINSSAPERDRGLRAHGEPVRDPEEFHRLRAHAGLLEADIRAMRNVLGAREGEGNVAAALRMSLAPRPETALPENLASDPVARRLLVDIVGAARELLDHGKVDPECHYAGRLETAITAYDDALLGRARATREKSVEQKEKR